MSDIMQQTSDEIALLSDDVDREIDKIINDRDGKKAVDCLMWLQYQIGANWLRLGRIATYIKAYKWWEGKADTWQDFLKDRVFFKVGPSEVMKCMRLWKFYIHKHGIEQKELAGYAQDALDAAKPMVEKDGWDEARKHLDLKQGDLRKTIKERTGQDPDWSAFTDRQVSGFMKLMQDGMEQHLEQFLRETGLNQLTHQKSCAVCGQFSQLQPHHDPPRAQGGKGIGNVWLCAGCHRKHHDGQFSDAETARYKKGMVVS